MAMHGDVSYQEVAVSVLLLTSKVIEIKACIVSRGYGETNNLEVIVLSHAAQGIDVSLKILHTCS